MVEGMIDWGYDLFIGREIFEDGDEYVVTLNLKSQGSRSYWSLEQACEELCDSVREGKSVLLSQSPGQVAPITGKTYTLAARRYEPFKPEQMDLLEKLYARKEEMKRFPDPFENQPYLH